MDREHFTVRSRIRGQEINEVKRFLVNKLNITIVDITELMPKCAFVINCSLGEKDFALCLAIRGTTLNAEEERVQLIQLELNSQVEPDHRKITHFFKQSGVDEEDLIRQSSINHLNQTFPSLCSALQWLEAQHNNS